MKKSDIQPFALCKNVYFVGSRRVSVHIIKSSSGLIMIDTGYPDMCEQILNSIKEVGLNSRDICAIFHSHGHIDHFGCTREFKEISGAKTYISRIDNNIVNGTYDFSCAKDVGYENLPPFDCDVLIEDGDAFEFGDVTVRCRLTPGHTDGVLSFFIDLEDGNIKITAAMHGGVGMNTMNQEYLSRYGLSADCREIFRSGLHSLLNEGVDLVLGNHPGQNDTEGKLKRILSGEESVLDKNEWKKFLARTEHTLDLMIENEKKELK